MEESSESCSIDLWLVPGSLGWIATLKFAFVVRRFQGQGKKWGRSRSNVDEETYIQFK